MAHVLFLDESGQDHHESPYEVLGGVAIEDSRIWPLITEIRQSELSCFGHRISRNEMELKGKKLLKRKTFRLAAQMPAFSAVERANLAGEAIAEGVAAKSEGRPSKHTRSQLTALAQAKLAFCERVFEVCAQHQVRAFASIVLPTAARPVGRALRKDYAYLFERFFLFLRDVSPVSQGIVVFDELEKSQSHILTNHMAEYFVGTANGRLRASRILPDPMFVHSDLTSAIQVADLAVYVISWAVRIKGMTAPLRTELGRLADAVRYLRYRTVEENADGEFERWSFVFLNDLRPLSEKAGATK